MQRPMTSQVLNNEPTNYRHLAQEEIHKAVMDSCDNNPALNGCNCPKCHGTQTYDTQWENNYYFGCVDCGKVVAIWLESEIADSVGLPWFIL